MSICPVAVGYNWKDQAGTNFDDWKTPMLFNAVKIADYVPLLSIISGIFEVFIGISSLKDDGYSPTALLLIARGVVAISQLGLLVSLPIDVIMTIVNGILSYKSNHASLVGQGNSN